MADFSPRVQVLKAGAFNDVLRTALERHGFSTFRALIAFLSVSGVRLIWQPLEQFVQGGGRIDWIIGTDLGITEADALEMLLDLQGRYPKQVRLRILRLPEATFHPKLYWLSGNHQHFALIGSANCTRGGLLRNLEVATVFDVKDSETTKTNQRFVADLAKLWNQVSKPESPLKSKYVLDLDSVLLGRLREYEEDVASRRPPAPTHPMDEVEHPDLLGKRKLVADLTREQGPGRMSQVQPSSSIWRYFFGWDMTGPRPSLKLTNLDDRTSVRRRVVAHDHNWTIEVPGADVPRPAILYMVRVGPLSYKYRILQPSHPRYKELSKSLANADNPLRSARETRRWFLSE